MTIHLINTLPKKEWPEIWNLCFSSIEKLPYNIKIWNVEDIENELNTYDKDFNQKLNHLDYIYKIDFIRYLILMRYGGVYLDMDVEVKINFFPTIKYNKIYLLEGTASNYINNAIIISLTPQMMMWKILLDQSKNLILSNYELCKTHPYWVTQVVGPGLLSKYVIENLIMDQGLNQSKIFFEILGKYQFGMIGLDTSICNHYHTQKWRKSLEDYPQNLDKVNII